MFEQLIQRLVRSREDLRLAVMNEDDSVIDRLVDLSNASYDARQRLVETMTAAGESSAAFALRGKTRGGLLLMLTLSAQKLGHWQLTRFDAGNQPWGDTQYPTLKQAVDEFVQDANIQTLDWRVEPLSKAA